MKRVYAIAVLMAVCSLAFGHSFQKRNNLLVERNYYNPAARYLQEGNYLKFYSLYEMDLPARSGKQPLDLNIDYMWAAKDYSVFASVSHDAYSYFSDHCISAGYNRFFNPNGGDHTFRVGGRLVLGFNNIDLSKLPYGETGRHLLMSPDFDLGLEYSYKFFHLGMSVKNVLALPVKYQGVDYICWPRAYFMQMYFDCNLLKDKILLNPFLILGLNQNVYMVAGADLTLFKNYRIGYSFRAPDLHQNFNLGVDILSWVTISAGYSYSAAHKYNSAHIALTFRLSPKK